MIMKYNKDYFDDVRLAIEAVPDITALFNKKIFITGSTGMICSAVVEILALLNKEKNAGIKIILAGRNKERIAERFKGLLEEDDFEFCEYDMTKTMGIAADADYIIHGAGNADPAKITGFPVETVKGNIEGLMSLLELARNNKGSRLLFLSSGEIYGNKDFEDGKNRFGEEDYGYVDILNPRACYPMSKRAAENLCISYNKEYGVDTVIARSCHIYGPSITASDSRATASFTRDAAAGKDIVMKSKGDQLRSYCYTLDCASALLTILIKGVSANAYNISNKDSVVTIRDMADALARAGGVKVVFENPSDAELKSYNMMNSSALDAAKLEGLGWRACFGPERGAEATLKYV